jgi:hypothetical protein
MPEKPKYLDICERHAKAVEEKLFKEGVSEEEYIYGKKPKKPVKEVNAWWID